MIDLAGVILGNDELAVWFPQLGVSIYLIPYLQILWMMMPHFLHSKISEKRPLVSLLHR